MWTCQVGHVILQLHSWYCRKSLLLQSKSRRERLIMQEADCCHPHKGIFYLNVVLLNDMRKKNWKALKIKKQQPPKISQFAAKHEANAQCGSPVPHRLKLIRQIHLSRRPAAIYVFSECNNQKLLIEKSSIKSSFWNNTVKGESEKR